MNPKNVFSVVWVGIKYSTMCLTNNNQSTPIYPPTTQTLKYVMVIDIYQTFKTFIDR